MTSCRGKRLTGLHKPDGVTRRHNRYGGGYLIIKPQENTKEKLGDIIPACVHIPGFFQLTGAILTQEFDGKIEEVFSSLFLESRTPKLGIWWVVKEAVVAFQVDFRDVPVVGVSRDSDLLHFQLFDKLALSGEYTDYERGRVVFLVKPAKFAIVGSKSLLTRKDLVVKIAREFHLPMSNLAIVADSHYDMHYDGGD